ncbi:MAG: helix-turn-helix transcriptional regulator [Propionibacteriaceae bacterium]|jgi:DNA-binding CsgD family transcriptional regulator|nr:helix-turn-helix transcriptional regulator [Propionibacteriaceae bacterium]
MRGKVSLLAGFGLFTYAFLTAELLFNTCAAGVLGEAAALPLYGGGCLAAAAGYLLWPLACRLPPDRHRQALLAVAALGAFCSLVLPFAANPALLVAAYLLGLLLAGMTGGAALHGLARQLPLPRLGITIAAPYAGAFALQALATWAAGLLAEPFAAALQHCLVAAALAAAGLLLPVAWPEAPRPTPTTTARTTRYLWLGLASCVVICCLFGLADGIVMNLYTGQQLDAQDAVRLICIPGILFAGWMADVKEGSLFPFATIAAMTAIIVAFHLFNTAETFNAALGCVYFFGSFMTMYSIAVFVGRAVRTANPSRWAVAGRAAKYLVGGIFALTSAALFNALGLLWVTAVYVLALIALLGVRLLSPTLNALPPEDVADDPPDALSEREHEVLAMLRSGATTAEISARLFITQNTVRVHIRNIKRKTGAPTREHLAR